MSEIGTLELIDFLQRMPKVEIHCHLLGTVRRDTFLDLRNKHQAPLSQEEVEGFYIRGEKPQGVLHILRALDEYFLLEAFGFGLDHLRGFMLNGLDGAWISDVMRRQWKREWTREFDRLRAQLHEEPQPAEDQL